MPQLPTRPDLDQLRRQAKELAERQRLTRPDHQLADAQLELARDYGFPSWPKLVAAVERKTVLGAIKEAIRAGNRDEVLKTAAAHPVLFEMEELDDNHGGPFVFAAQCGNLELVQALRPFGDPDLQHALSRAAMKGHLNVIRYLIDTGADPNGPYRRGSDYGPPILACCEVHGLAGMEALLEMGASLWWKDDQGRERNPVGMLIGTYTRDPEAKQACIELCLRHGFELPDTAPMALHRRDLHRLGELLDQDGSLLNQAFTEAEIYPPSFGIAPGEGSSGAPIPNTTLLHQAVEWCDLDAVRFLLARGADANARAVPGPEGFSNQTPLFHTSLSLGDRSDITTRLLVEAGADPRLTADLKRDVPSEEFHLEIRGVSAREAGDRELPTWLKNSAAVEYLRSLEA